jgi:hypothetical protein
MQRGSHTWDLLQLYIAGCGEVELGTEQNGDG